MLNILSYIGVNLQSELCLWTLVGLLRTIFDATLFKVNANLKQVWQMSMPPELSMPVQRGLRTMISGVMLVQCFTVYVYLAAYIVLLYPVFLEERPTLVLPWLLLAAVRKFLCELTSLALGLGACVLLGPARPPCVKFVIFKIASITPAFYMWMLVFSYYNTLKVAAAFKRFPAVLVSSEHNYGLELAVRRRRTKSLLGEEQLRRRLVASLNYEERSPPPTPNTPLRQKSDIPTRMVRSTHANFEDIKAEMKDSLPFHVSVTERVMSDLGSYEDWCGGELIVPRNSDRILEQLVTMMLRIGAFLKTGGTNPEKLFGNPSIEMQSFNGNMDCTNLDAEDTDTPPLVGNTKGKTASYLQEYPQIFMKKAQESQQLQNEQTLNSIQNTKTENVGSQGNINISHSSTINNLNVKVKTKNENVLEKANEGGESRDQNSNMNLSEHNIKPNQNENTTMHMLKVNLPSQIRIFSEHSLVQKNESFNPSSATESANLNTQTDSKYNTNQEQASKYKSSSIDGLNFDVKSNIFDPKTDVERDLKQVSMDTYYSNQPIPTESHKIREKVTDSPAILPTRSTEVNMQQKDAKSVKIIESKDSLESILKRMRTNLPEETKSLKQDETTNEADEPTSTRTLNIKEHNSSNEKKNKKSPR